MNALEFFLLHHANVHRQVQQEFLMGLTDDQLRHRPYPGANSIAWLIWHMARCEDVGVNRLVADKPQVLSDSEWRNRLRIPLSHIGTGMTDEEVSGFGEHVDLGGLRAYYNAVGQRTPEVLKDLQQHDLDQTHDTTYLHRVLIGEAALGENAGQLEQFYLGKTRGWFLGHLGLGHNQMHRGEALTIRGLLGIRNG